MFKGDLIETVGAATIAIAVFLIFVSIVATTMAIGFGLLVLGAFCVYVAQGLATSPVEIHVPIRLNARRIADAITRKRDEA